MKHENDVSDMLGYLQVVKIYSFKKERKKIMYIHAVYIVFFLVKSEHINHIKGIKHVLCALITRWKPRQSLWEFLNKSFKRLPQFLQGYKGTREKVLFLNWNTIIIIFIFLFLLLYMSYFFSVTKLGGDVQQLNLVYVLGDLSYFLDKIILIIHLNCHPVNLINAKYALNTVLWVGNYIILL